MVNKNNSVEQIIVAAIQALLSGKVNELLQKYHFFVPPIQFGNFSLSKHTVSPTISLSAHELTEKERIARLNIYIVTIRFTFHQQNELYCYAYARTIRKAITDDPTLGGVVDWIDIIGKASMPPKKMLPHDKNWSFIIPLCIVNSLLPLGGENQNNNT